MQPHSKGFSKPNYLKAVPRQPLTSSPDEELDNFFGANVSDESVHEAQIVDMVPFDARPVQRVTFSKTIMPLVCPTCHIPISDDAYGRMRDYSQHTDHTGHFQKFGYCEIPCPTCSGDAQQRRHFRQQAELVQRLFGGADIPWKMRDWNFTNYPVYGDQQAKETIQTTIAAILGGANKRRGLWFGGDLGRGKTSLAVAALKEAIHCGHLGLFVLTPDLFNRIRASYGKDSSENGDELLEMIQRVSWLVLDDIGVERPTYHVLEKLYNIVSLRMQRGLYTIFTSNFNPRDLEEHWCQDPKNVMIAQRVIARIREYCAGIIVKGINLREKAK